MREGNNIRNYGRAGGLERESPQGMSAHSNGFTLLEILITVIIVGVIGSLAFVNYNSMIERVKAKEAIHSLLEAYMQFQREATENRGVPPRNCGASGILIPDGLKVSGFDGPYCSNNNTSDFSFYINRSIGVTGYSLLLTKYYVHEGDTIASNNPPNLFCIDTGSDWCTRLGLGTSAISPFTLSPY